jgi:HK97 gp10 family phage protein
MAASDVRVGVELSATFRANRQNLDQLINGPDGPVAKDLERRAIQVERRAKRMCPVDTGRLRASITHGLETSGGLSAVVGTGVGYAVFVEFGTGDTRAQPFLRPALKVKGLSGG